VIAAAPSGSRAKTRRPPSRDEDGDTKGGGGHGAGAGAEHVIVLGAGVVGVATAYALARQGARVTLVDRLAAPALGTSYANGAQLSYAYSDALGTPALLKKLPSLIFGADPLFAVHPAFDVDMVRWGLRFIRESSALRSQRNTLATLELALESQQALHDLLGVHPLSFGYAAAGKMHLYYGREALAQAEAGVALKRMHGVEQHVLGVDEAVKLEPALRGADGLSGVVYSPKDEVGDPHLFCVALAKLLEEHYSVQSRFGFDVSQIALRSDGVTLCARDGERLNADQLVVATGADAKALLKPLGVEAPILPMKGYSFTAAPGPEAPTVSLTDTLRKLVFCNLNGRIRVAGGAELGARTAAIDEARLSTLVKQAKAALAGACDYQVLDSHWAGLRPMTAPSTPIIAKPKPRLIVNIGHGMLGWTLAMGAGERAAALTLKEDAKLSSSQL